MHERLADFLFCAVEKTDLGHEERVDKFCVWLGCDVEFMEHDKTSMDYKKCDNLEA
jgi:hypothetical protein